MIGEIKQICHNLVPEGYELCDGQKLSIAGNRELFELIGYSYGGEGDFFNLPDFMGMVLIHKSESYGLAEKGGSDKQTLSNENLPEHYHNISGDIKGTVLCNEEDGESIDPTGKNFSNNESEFSYSSSDNDLKMAEGNVEIKSELKCDSFGEGKSFSIMQPYGVVNFIIKVD